MAKAILKKIARRGLRAFGFEVRRVSPLKWRTLGDALQHAKGLGFAPDIIFDVGAADGTPELIISFPSVRTILIEPLEEFKSALQYLANTSSNIQYILAAAGERSGTALIHVHPDLYGSSIYLEQEADEVNGLERQVPMVTLDELWIQNHFDGTCLLKLDVQGAELDVLSGAASVLEHTEYIIIEATLFQIYDNQITFFDLIQSMNKYGFVPYEFIEPKYRLLDNAMHQIDVVFVRNNSLFRQDHTYASPEYRQRQNQKFIEHYAQQKSSLR